MKVVNLFSGSKGNSTLVQFGSHNLLIDAGKNMKQINLALLEYDLTLEDISMILVTHRHSDHISSIPVIRNNYPKIKYVMNDNIFNEMEEKYTANELKWKFNKEECLFINERKNGNIINITPFDLQHDVYCIGYLIEEHSSGESLVFISDNGKLYDKDIINLITNKTYYMIESNHDRTLQVLDSKRDPRLKKRVLGSWGHTNNYDAITLAIRLVEGNTKSICFHHLSEECNNHNLAKAVHDNVLEFRCKKTQFKDVKMQYAYQDKSTVL